MLISGLIKTAANPDGRFICRNLLFLLPEAALYFEVLRALVQVAAEPAYFQYHPVFRSYRMYWFRR